MKNNKNIFSVLILSASTFIVGVLSYTYHPIMIRFLDLKQFVEFKSLIGIINLLGVIVMAISLSLGSLDKKYYILNPDGTIDIEVTLYFKPQLYFYIGILFSVSLFVFFCFGLC